MARVYSIRECLCTNHPYRSPGQVSSYLSTIVSIGDIILSLLFVRLNRTKEKETAKEAWGFLSNWMHPKYGLGILAIVYSLPYVGSSRLRRCHDMDVYGRC
ncbi:hypothetical protein BDQ17DRAFT_1004348 [Cyathus striatus]|nr:hypothetical protein BDQ17DRAFT_1004348 [Cyathus striatus]